MEIIIISWISVVLAAILNISVAVVLIKHKNFVDNRQIAISVSVLVADFLFCVQALVFLVFSPQDLIHNYVFGFLGVLSILVTQWSQLLHVFHDYTRIQNQGRYLRLRKCKCFLITVTVIWIFCLILCIGRQVLGLPELPTLDEPVCSYRVIMELCIKMLMLAPGVLQILLFLKWIIMRSCRTRGRLGSPAGNENFTIQDVSLMRRIKLSLRLSSVCLILTSFGWPVVNCLYTFYKLKYPQSEEKTSYIRSSPPIIVSGIVGYITLLPIIWLYLILEKLCKKCKEEDDIDINMREIEGSYETEYW